MTTTVVQFPGNLAAVEDLSDLRQVVSTALNAKASIFTQGSDVFGDAGGALFAWDPGFGGDDDGDTIIRPADRTPSQLGRWRIVLGGGFEGDGQEGIWDPNGTINDTEGFWEP